jgi:hypothetical protein
MRHQLSDILAGSRAYHRQLDRDLFEVRGCIVNVVLLGVSEGRPNIGRRIIDGDFVERREPRQLRQ